MTLHRRQWLRLAALGLLGARPGSSTRAGEATPGAAPLRISGLKVTPIALPDPPLLNKSGCHGPYFLRNVVELETDGRIVGIGETTGGRDVTAALERARELVVGKSAFGYRDFARQLNPACYAAIE